MKNLLNSCRKTLSQLSKMFLRVQATFSCYSFCENCANFFWPFVFWLIQLHFRLNFLRQGLQNCTLRARGSFRGKMVDVRFFCISSTVSGFEQKFFGFMAKTVRQPCQKCTFSASGTKRRKFCVEKMYHFLTFFRLQGGSFRTLSALFQKFRQNRIFCLQRNFLD